MMFMVYSFILGTPIFYGRWDECERVVRRVRSAGGRSSWAIRQAKPVERGGTLVYPAAGPVASIVDRYPTERSVTDDPGGAISLLRQRMQIVSR